MKTQNVVDGLTACHDAMVAEFKRQMPWLATVDAYQPLGGGLSVTSPAILIEAVEMHPGRRITDGRTPVEVEFAAHCVLSVNTENVALEIRNFAALVLQIVDGNRWGLVDLIERPAELAAYPGMFKPDDKGFESWVASWKQTIHLGRPEVPPDYLPTEVFMGEYPAVGADHADDYTQG